MNRISSVHVCDNQSRGVSVYKISFAILAFVFIFSSGFSQEFSKIKSLKDSLENVKNDSIKLSYLNEIAYYLIFKDLNESIHYINKARKLAYEIKSISGLAESHKILASYYRYKSNFSESLKNLHFSKQLYEYINDPEGISSCYSNFGNIYQSIENDSLALENYEKSLEIKEMLNDSGGIAVASNNLGTIKMELELYSEAESSFRRSLDIYKKLESEIGVAVCMSNIGESYYQRENYFEALKFTEPALNKIKVLYADSEMVTHMYYLNAAIYKNIGKYYKALNYALKGLKIAEELDLLKNQADLNKLLSEIYNLKKQFKAAYTYHLKYTVLHDSVFNEKNIKEITTLENRYEYEKEKQAIQLIRQKENAVNTEKLKQQKKSNTTFIFGFILMAVLVVVTYSFFLQKKRSNIELKDQKMKVEEKNTKLKEQNRKIQLLNEELSTTNDQLNKQKQKLTEMYDELKLTQSKLIESAKMASLGILTSGIAHEINNPMNFIQGGIFSLEAFLNENYPDSKKEIDPIVEIIKNGIERTSIIINSLAEFSHADMSGKQLCSLHSIIDNCVLILSNKIENRIFIKKQYQSDNDSIEGNQGRLHQALMNILLNAVHAIEEEGQISIDTKIQNEFLMVTISDTGKGIKKEDIQHITDPFYTTKDPGEGIGMGLSIAYQIIKDHNGTIEFKSDVNIGTEVTICFPQNKIEKAKTDN